jgi:hypothetical protein
MLTLILRLYNLGSITKERALKALHFVGDRFRSDV